MDRQLLAVRASAAARLRGWARYTDPQYAWPPHIRLLCDTLEAVERGDIKNLIVELPPRHGKTATTSIKFPAWFLGRNPDARVIIASHTAQLAHSISRQSRNDFSEHGEAIFGQKIADDSAAMDHWNIHKRKGGLLALGVGGKVSGHGADLFILDDVVKSAEAAYSKLQRDRLWEWYTHEARTRLHPGARVVIVLTRWHLDDIVGRILKGQTKWERIRLPALAEPDDQLGREEGQALWPARYSEQDLLELKATIGSMAWSALYQQRPIDAAGGIVKRETFRYWESLPDDAADYLQSWDLTVKETDDGSFVVGQVWARKGANKFLLDQTRRRMGFGDTLNAIRSMSARWPQARTKLIEDKASGSPAIEVLRNEIPGIIAVNPRGSKQERLTATVPDFEAGNVFFPSRSSYPWVEDLEEELLGQPGHPYNDQSDALSQALNRYAKRPAVSTVSIPADLSRQTPWMV